MGVIYWHLGELDRAASALRAAVAAEPRYADAHARARQRPQGDARLDRRERLAAARDCHPARPPRLALHARAGAAAQRRRARGPCRIRRGGTAATTGGARARSARLDVGRHPEGRCGGPDGSAEQFPPCHLSLRTATRRLTIRPDWSSSAWASEKQRARHSSARGRSTQASFHLRISDSPGYPVAASGYPIAICRGRLDTDVIRR